MQANKPVFLHYWIITGSCLSWKVQQIKDVIRHTRLRTWRVPFMAYVHNLQYMYQHQEEAWVPSQPYIEFRHRVQICKWRKHTWSWGEKNVVNVVSLSLIGKSLMHFCIDRRCVLPFHKFQPFFTRLAGCLCPVLYILHLNQNIVIVFLCVC